MTAGERAALEGVLARLAPELAIEIGTAQGGSLACIASHAREVHSFDLVPPAPSVAELPNVTIHTGDSHVLVPDLLAQLEGENRAVEFALVDGDHTAEGVQADVLALLRSAAVRRAVIMLHDTANEEVRAGLEAIEFGSFAKVRAVDLDFVPGFLVRAQRFHHELWGGLGMVLVDDTGAGEAGLSLVSDIAYPATEVLARHRGRLDDEVRIAELERRLATVTGSRSWRATQPLRAIAARLRAGRRDAS